MIGPLAGLEGFEKIAYHQILPGFALSLLWGNIYYAWMAVKLAKKEDRSDVCAQPYGINTPGAVRHFLKNYVGPPWLTLVLAMCR